MTTRHPDLGTCLLPLLLTLPAGVVAGIPAWPRCVDACLEDDLDAFGPRLRADREVRHAVSRAPGRVVVETGSVTTPVLEAALPVLRQAGTVVVVRSDDRGLLARLADLVLRGSGTEPAWLRAESCRAMRCLELRVDGAAPAAAAWIRVPLDGPEGAEAVLSAARADG
ncbi:MAG TPA: hypothetical protein P5319_06335, partial [Gemmatimonadales bacterium]|nr:hypothetical protein [Gemmatimonadales bacterium]